MVAWQSVWSNWLFQKYHICCISDFCTYMINLELAGNFSGYLLGWFGRQKQPKELRCWLVELDSCWSLGLQFIQSICRNGIISIWYRFSLCFIKHKNLGLWVADLSITQIMQESVAETERGTVFGVENALCMLFSVCKDLMAILLPNPKTFGILILISFVTVFLGLIQYLYFLIVTNTESDKVKKAESINSLCNVHLW